MSDENMRALIIAAALLVAVGVVIFFLRGKIKNAEVRAGGMSAKVGTHEPDRIIVKNVEQDSKQGGNQAIIHTTNTTVDGFKQTAQKDNVLDIGNP